MRVVLFKYFLIVAGTIIFIYGIKDFQRIFKEGPQDSLDILYSSKGLLAGLGFIVIGLFGF